MDISADGAAPDPALASLSRRLSFAGNAWYLFDRIFTGRMMSRFARMGHAQTARLFDHPLRVAFDLVECARTGSWVPNIGTVEHALDAATGLIPQHPRYRGYWLDRAAHSMVGMILGVDLIRRDGRYYVLELNHGPSLYARRRSLYETPFDPIVSTMAEQALALGFERLVPIGFRWSREYVEEMQRAGDVFGLEVEPVNCPLVVPSTPNRIVALPDPLPPKTMYVIHSGLWTPLCRYVDNKWYSFRWLGDALRHELSATTRLAMPETRDSFFFPGTDYGERWPNLVVKLAGGARGEGVIMGRFRDEDDARDTLGIDGATHVPRQLRGSFVSSMLFFGRERVLYQEFVPPEIDADGHARLVRVHVLVSPLCTTYLSAHFRKSRQPVPEHVQRGIIKKDEAFIVADSVYERVPPDIEEEAREVARDLGVAIRAAIERRFVVGT